MEEIFLALTLFRRGGISPCLPYSSRVSNNLFFSVHSQLLLSMCRSRQLPNVWRALVGFHSIFGVLSCLLWFLFWGSLLYYSPAAATSSQLHLRFDLEVWNASNASYIHFNTIRNIARCMCLFEGEERQKTWRQDEGNITYAAIKCLGAILSIFFFFQRMT